VSHVTTLNVDVNKLRELLSGTIHDAEKVCSYYRRMSIALDHGGSLPVPVETINGRTYLRIVKAKETAAEITQPDASPSKK
jgi:hypothetical protein